MKTSISTFQKSKTGDLKFPRLYNQFGIITNQDLIEYIDTMSDAGHNWTLADFNAFKAFVQEGENAGWWEHLIYVAPLWGDADVPLVLGINLKCGIGTQKNALIARIGDYGVSTNWPVFVDANNTVNGKIIGTRGSEPLNNSCIATPFFVSDLIAKPGFAGAGTFNFGVTTLMKNNGVDTMRAFSIPYNALGAGGSDVYIVIWDMVSDARTLMWRGGRTPAPLTKAYESTDYFFQMNWKGLAGRLLAGTFSSVTELDGAGTALSALDASALSVRRLSYAGGQLWNTTDNLPGTVIKSVDAYQRWFSIDDGELLDNTMSASYRSALATLFAALNKNF